MPVEFVRASTEQVESFVRLTEREALKSLFEFSVIWHEQRHDLAALEGTTMVALAQIRIAASLAHVEHVVVLPEHRGKRIGRELLEHAAGAASYYNCHKMTALVPHKSTAQTFFERCGYREEAVLPQHTFKLDMAVLRKFLL